MAKKQFKAESKRLLDLMINSIYTNKEIFLREIISNASDAIDKLCYLSLTDDQVGMNREDYRIDVLVDVEKRTITVRDNGIGMNQEEAENNLGVIAKSGSYKFKSELEGEKPEDISIIGQFGVGFYSAFMIADEVTVITRKYGEEQAICWQSKGADGYTVSPCEREQVGTDVIMHVKADSEEESYSDYLDSWKLRELVRKYSDYVRWPIHMNIDHQKLVETEEKDENGEPKYEYQTITENQVVNSMVPIWQRSKSEVSDADCVDFYKEKNHGRKDPCALVRINAEGAVSYKALLFVPGESDENTLIAAEKPGITLYSNGVMIMEKCESLVSEHFRFVTGVVDSPDLSLNISREILQHDRQLQIIGQNLDKRIKGELEKMQRDRRETYEEFFKNFGVYLKCGVCNEYGRNRENLQDLLMFYVGEDKMITLKEYLEKMPESQKGIYFACANSPRLAMSLPQCEDVRRRGFAILYLGGPLDEMMMSSLMHYEGKKFINVATDDLGFETEEDKKLFAEREEANRELLDFVKETLGEGYAVVRFSRKIIDQPCCLTTEGNVTLEMEKYFRGMPDYDGSMRAQYVLEINADHPAFAALKAAVENDKDKAAKMAEIATWATICAVTDLDPELLSNANITPFPTVADAVADALEADPEAKVIVLMDGSVTIPRVE